MLELKIYLSEELNKRFRRVAMNIYGYGRGSLSKAAEEAFARWCSEHDPSSSSLVAATVAKVGGDRGEPKEGTIDPDERQKPENPENTSDRKNVATTGKTL